jgi:S1-C subfamily serine protease
MLGMPASALSQSAGGSPARIFEPVLTLRGPGSQIGATFRNVEPGSTVPGRGAVVIEVQAKSPAAMGGLRTGDLVTEFDGIGVSDARALSRLVADTPPGHTVDVTVRRDGRVRTLKLTPTLGRPLG